MREYKVSDWSGIDDPIEPFAMTASKEFLDLTKQGVAITGLDNGVPMACGGIALINGKGAVWLRVSKKAKRNAFGWLRTIMETFDLMLKSLGCDELFTYVVDNFEKGDRMAKAIGMNKTNQCIDFNGHKYYKYVVKQ